MNDQLNILILTLVSGEEVITNLKDHFEEVNGVKQKVCYNMVYPFTVEEIGSELNNEVGVAFKPWKKFSCDTSFLIGYDKIINMCAPLGSLTDEYKKAVDGLLKTLAEEQQ
tara:strand:- start:732 stop:1064 length:333 start_codon:yes stop_codon:yes gene_type:complete